MREYAGAGRQPGPAADHGASRQRGAARGRSDLLERYRAVRGTTEALCAPLEIEDFVVQASADASPAKWHLAHTSWFFETFLLEPFGRNYRSYDKTFAYLFNSYYETVGPFFARPLRGHLSRPTVEDVFRYRHSVDERMAELLSGDALAPEIAVRTELGLNHEAQHQELILTDLKVLFGVNPLRPAYRAVGNDARHPPAGAEPARAAGVEGSGWQRVAPGLRHIGHAGDGFSFDNESPRHQVYLHPAELAERPVSNGQYMAFIEDGGYRRAEFWLSEAWKAVSERGWTAPLYWERSGAEWWNYTLAGMRRVDEDAPVCHVSYYEADAYARWAGCRLPTEMEWETVAAALPVQGNFLESRLLQPRAAAAPQWYGDVWVWTQSAYTPYPGSERLSGSLGEYNGKFMVNQLVLRGGSCASPAWHIRPTYRNFFYGPDRWQFTGLRLARDLRD
jgi:ergothioneine biosynthesis protein EgtB